ncbi:MAG: hypothetical protein GWP03_03030 [Proteobacteria bacterium]|nr:hypothetical protein [Pseudomonadota bacterium]
MLRNQTVNQINVSRDIRFDFDNKISLTILPDSVLAVPIKRGDIAGGAVVFYNKSLHRKYMKSDEEVANLIADIFKSEESEINIEENIINEAASINDMEVKSEEETTVKEKIPTVTPVGEENIERETEAVVKEEKAIVSGKATDIYKIALESISLPIVLIDKDLKILFINGAFSDAFNLTKDNIILKDITKVMDFRTENNDNLWEKIKIDFFNNSQDLGMNKVTIVVKENESNIKKYNVISNYIKFDDHIMGKSIEFIPVPTEEELQAKEEEFIQNVSHELRTPLSAILGSIQILMSSIGDESALGETEKRFLSIINEEGEKFSKVIENIIGMNMSSSGEVGTIKKEEVDLVEIISDAVKQYEEKAKKKNITIVVDLSDKLGSIKGDKMALFYVFSQLTDNAVKFNKENGEVKVSSPGLIIFDNIWQAQVTVRDTGIGISKEDIPYIFDKFFRVENKVHTEAGTGLGLSTVKDIITNHGGMITCKSEPGEWTEFTVMIPAESML